MTHCEIRDKILELRPGAIWTLRGDAYEGLEWLDAIQTKPTAEEIGF